MFGAKAHDVDGIPIRKFVIEQFRRDFNRVWEEFFNTNTNIIELYKFLSFRENKF